MKKMLPIILIGMFVLYGLGAVASTNTTTQHITEPRTKALGEPMDFTHAVFAEYATATWCTYCKYAHAALKTIYASEDYPFSFVSLVCELSCCSTRLAIRQSVFELCFIIRLLLLH